MQAFLIFIFAQATSEMGDTLFTIGMQNFAYDSGLMPASQLLALFFLMRVIPILLFSNRLASSMHTDWIKPALISDAGRVILCVLFGISLFFSSGFLTIFFFCTFLFFREIFSLQFNNARNCLIPKLYPDPSQLTKAHTLASVSALVASAAAQIVLFLVMKPAHQVDEQWLAFTTFADGMTFFISLLALLCLQKISPLGRSAPSKARNATKNGIVKAFTSGWEVLSHYPQIRFLLGLSFLYNFVFMGPLLIGEVYFFRSDLNLPPRYLTINLLLFVLGVLAGSYLLSRTKLANKNPVGFFSKVIFWDGVSYFPVALAGWGFFSADKMVAFYWAVPCLFIHFLCVPFVRTSRMVAIQTHVPEKHWSTVLGFHALAVEGAAALSVLMTALFGAHLSGSTLLFVGGSLAAVCGVLGLLFQNSSWLVNQKN